MSKFLGHLVQRRGYKGTFIPAGEPIPLMNGRGTVTPIYDGPPNVPAALRNPTAEPEGVVLDRDQIAKIIDPEAFVPMEDIIGMRRAYVKADQILAGAAPQRGEAYD